MILSIIPEYMDGIGDCSRVKRMGREIVHEKKIDTVIKELYRNSFVDYCAVRRKSADVLKQKCLIPLYVNQSEILIPIKVRESLCSHDSCYGYVNVFGIQKVFKKELLMKNGEHIPFLDTKRAVQKREFMAECLRERFSSIGGGQASGMRSEEPSDVVGDYLLLLLRKAAQRESGSGNQADGSNKSEEKSFEM